MAVSRNSLVIVLNQCIVIAVHRIFLFIYIFDGNLEFLSDIGMAVVLMIINDYIYITDYYYTSATDAGTVNLVMMRTELLLV